MLPDSEHDTTHEPDAHDNVAAGASDTASVLQDDAAHTKPPAHVEVPGSSDAVDRVPERFAAIADGQLHEVDPRYVPAERVGWWIFLGIVSLPSFIVLMLAWPFGWFGQPGLWITSASWVAVTLTILFFTLRWPQLTFKHTRYCVSGVGIEIRKGVLWRNIHNIPRNRIQHTDVRQGPLERRFGIATLLIFTAGTANSSVELNGLTHARALEIRDYLIASEEEDDGV